RLQVRTSNRESSRSDRPVPCQRAVSRKAPQRPTPVARGASRSPGPHLRCRVDVEERPLWPLSIRLRFRCSTLSLACFLSSDGTKSCHPRVDYKGDRNERIAIGANVAVFSVVNAILLRPLPYRDPARLAWFAGNEGKGGLSNQTYTVAAF